MKRFKKILATAMALLILPALSVTAFAAADGSKDEPWEGSHAYGTADGGTINLFKLDMSRFEREKKADLVKNHGFDPGGTVTYTPKDKPTGLALQPTDVVGTYVTSTDNTPVPVTLAEMQALGNIVFHLEQVTLTAGKTAGSTTPGDYELVTTPTNGISDYARTGADGRITWSGLPLGYYRISEETNDTGTLYDSGSYIISLPMQDPANPAATVKTVNLYPKNITKAGPVVEKDVPAITDYNGNILKWTIRAEVPASLKAAKGDQKYEITDTMSQGLTYAGNVRMFYKNGSGTEVEVAASNYIVDPSTVGGNTLKITLNDTGFNTLGTALANIAKVDEKHILYITYDTTVFMTKDEFDSTLDPKNEVHLEFINNDGTTYTDDTGAVIMPQYAGLKLTQKDGSDQSILLPGVQFNVYTKLLAGDTDVDPASKMKASDGTDLVLTTDSNGVAFYGGLGAGKYHLVEIAPLVNYKPVTGFTTVTIEDTDVTGNVIKEATILNYRDNSFTLPATGGMGTMMFILVGLGLVAAAGAIFIISRRRASHKR